MIEEEKWGLINSDSYWKNDELEDLAQWKIRVKSSKMTTNEARIIEVITGLSPQKLYDITFITLVGILIIGTRWHLCHAASTHAERVMQIYYNLLRWTYFFI